MSDSPQTDLSGRTVGEYEITARIGVGGMGVVYEGKHPLIGKRVAVKVLLPSLSNEKELVDRFLAEARAVNEIRHRGIVDIFSFGQLPDGSHYFVMEYLQGEAFDKLIRKKAPMAVGEALTYIEEVLDALDAAHQAGIIHRDIKPSNIFLVDTGRGRPYVKLLDFGIAKLGALQGESTPQTRASVIIGTPDYMSPEQARGLPISPATDVYAIACVLFEMLTRKRLFKGENQLQTMWMHVEDAPPNASSLNPNVPPELDEALKWALEKKSENRPRTADEFRQHLEAIRKALPVDQQPMTPAPVSGRSRPLPTGQSGPIPVATPSAPVASLGSETRASPKTPLPKTPAPATPSTPAGRVKARPSMPPNAVDPAKATFVGPAPAGRAAPDELPPPRWDEATNTNVVAPQGLDAKKMAQTAPEHRATSQTTPELMPVAPQLAPEGEGDDDLPPLPSKSKLPVVLGLVGVVVVLAIVGVVATSGGSDEGSKKPVVEAGGGKPGPATTPGKGPEKPPETPVVVAKDPVKPPEKVPEKPPEKTPEKPPEQPVVVAKDPVKTPEKAPEKVPDKQPEKPVAAAATGKDPVKPAEPPQEKKGGITAAQLEQRLAKLEQKLAAREAQTGEKDRVLRQFLDQAKGEVAGATTDAQRRDAWKFLDEIAGQFGR